jgi:ligand-binding SRPBCC domain-containing protein
MGPVLARLLAAADRAPRGLHTLRVETVVATPQDETFAFFADATNLERLTPPWVNFEIRTPLPIEMHEGAILDYRIRLHGVPIPWRTRIDVWEPGVRFVDRQLIGPYRWWRHEHHFESVADGTRVTDIVHYLPRASWLSRAFVRRDVERIFTYRAATLRSLLAQT